MFLLEKILNKFPKLIVVVFLLFAVSPALANNSIQERFNRRLIEGIGETFFNGGLLSATGGFMKSLLGICFLIGITQALSQVGGAMYMAMTRLAMNTFLCVAILGLPEYQDSGLYKMFETRHPDYQYTGQKSLDRDIFNFMAYKFNSMADSMMANKGPSQLVEQSIKANQFLGRVGLAMKQCSQNDTNCQVRYLSGSHEKPPQTPKEIEDAKAAASANKKDGFFGGVEELVGYARQMVEFVSAFSTPQSYILPAILWLLDLVRIGMNMFLLIGFGLITALSLFLAKLICPFLLVERYRANVINAFKIPLSTTLYGFATSLVIYISVIVLEGLNNASTSIIVAEFSKGESGSTFQATYTVMLSTFVAQIIILGMQIAAIQRIPSLCKALMDMSLTEVVNFATDLAKSAQGLVGSITKLTTVVATGGAAAFAGSALGAGLGTLRGAGSAVMNRFRGSLGLAPRSGSGSGGGLSGGGGSGGGGNRPTGGGGAPGFGFGGGGGTPAPSRGGGLASTARDMAEESGQRSAFSLSSIGQKTAAGLSSMAGSAFKAGFAGGGTDLLDSFGGAVDNITETAAGKFKSGERFKSSFSNANASMERRAGQLTKRIIGTSKFEQRDSVRNLASAAGRREVTTEQETISNLISSGGSMNAAELGQANNFLNQYNLDDKTRKGLSSAITEANKANYETILSGKGKEAEFEQAYKSRSANAEMFNALKSQNKDFALYAKGKDREIEKIISEAKGTSNLMNTSGAILAQNAAHMVNQGFMLPDELKTAFDRKPEGQEQFNVVDKTVAQENVKMQDEIKKLAEKKTSSIPGMAALDAARIKSLIDNAPTLLSGNNDMIDKVQSKLKANNVNLSVDLMNLRLRTDENKKAALDSARSFRQDAENSGEIKFGKTSFSYDPKDGTVDVSSFMNNGKQEDEFSNVPQEVKREVIKKNKEFENELNRINQDQTYADKYSPDEIKNIRELYNELNKIINKFKEK